MCVSFLLIPLSVQVNRTEMIDLYLIYSVGNIFFCIVELQELFVFGIHLLDMNYIIISFIISLYDHNLAYS